MPEPSNDPKPLLQPAEDVLISARPAPFSVRDHFQAGKGVRFSTIWADFKDSFLGLSEPPAPETRVRKYKLLRFAPDGPIIYELGGESKMTGTLAITWSLLKVQPAGQSGFLQTNGFANIFYVRDGKGILCAIRVGWADDGWVIDSIPVDDPLAWNGQHLIFAPMPIS